MCDHPAAFRAPRNCAKVDLLKPAGEPRLRHAGRSRRPRRAGTTGDCRWGD